jgi:competence protein ComEC
MNRVNASFIALFALSLWCSLFYSGSLPGWIVVLVALISLAAAVTLLTLEPPHWKRYGLAMVMIGMGVAISYLGTPRSPWRSDFTYTALPAERVAVFHGVMSDDSSVVPGSDGPLSRYPVKLKAVETAGGHQSGSAAGYVLVWIRGGEMLFRGQSVTVRARLIPTHEPGRFSFTSWAAPRHIQTGAFERKVDRLRAAVFAELQSKLGVLSPEPAALLQVLLLGRKEALRQPLYDQFRTSGSLHLLALSGLHLGILYFLLSLLLGFVRDRRIRRIVVGALLMGYLYLVGWRPSLERAAVMILIAALGSALDREPRPLNLLGLAAALLLLLRPYYAFELSFQLSFLSLTAVLLLGPYLQCLWQPYLPSVVGWPLAVSLSAQIGTAPLILQSFGALYPIGILAAIVLIPLVTVFMAAGLLFWMCAFLSTIVSGWLAGLLGALYRLITLSLGLFSRFPALYLTWKPLYWGLLSVLLFPLIVEIRLHYLSRRSAKAQSC